MTICYDELCNIDGSTLVTFDGLTSFRGIVSIIADSGIYTELVSTTLTSGTGRFGTLYSSEIYASSIYTDILTWQDPLSKHYVAFTVPALTTNTTYYLPKIDGQAGEALMTDGKGNLSFGDAGGKSAPSDAQYILNKPNDKLSNSQAMSKLQAGIVYNLGGSGILYTRTPIGFEDLPPLSIPEFFPTPPFENILRVGQVYVGTETGVPKPSSILAECANDIALINARFLTANFIMGHGNIATRTLFPGSQFLSNLEEGILKQDAGVISIAQGGVDYVEIGPQKTPMQICLIDSDGQKYISTSHMQVTPNIIGDNDDVSGIFTLKADSVITKSTVRTEGDMISYVNMQTNQLVLFDNNPVHRKNIGLSLRGPETMAANITLVMPSEAGEEGQVLTDVGDAAPYGTRQLGWKGAATSEATYIIQTQDDGLPNAQALFDTITANSLLKWEGEPSSKIVDAVAGEDYPTVKSVEEAQEAAEAAQAAADAAAAAAADALAAIAPLDFPFAVSISIAAVAATAAGAAATAGTALSTANTAKGLAEDAKQAIEELSPKVDEALTDISAIEDASYVLLSNDSELFPHAQNLGELSTGFVKSTVVDGVATLSTVSGGEGVGTVSAIIAGEGLATPDNQPITSVGTIGLRKIRNKGYYNMSNITVNEYGQVVEVDDGAPRSVTENSVVIWGNSSGSSLLSSAVTITETDTLNVAYLTFSQGINSDVTVWGEVWINDSNSLYFAHGNNVEYVALQPPSTITASYILTLPSASGSAGQALVTDGNGQLSFATVAGSGVQSVTAGTGLTGGTITDTGTIDIASTGVMAGTYNIANITVNAQGQVTTATSAAPQLNVRFKEVTDQVNTLQMQLKLLNIDGLIARINGLEQELMILKAGKL